MIKKALLIAVLFTPMTLNAGPLADRLQPLNNQCFMVGTSGWTELNYVLSLLDTKKKDEDKQAGKSQMLCYYQNKIFDNDPTGSTLPIIGKKLSIKPSITEHEDKAEDGFYAKFKSFFTFN